GHDDPLQLPVLPAAALAADDRALHLLAEVGGARDRVGQAPDEPAHLPREALAHELLLAAREVAVDGGARQARLAGRVLDRGLGQPVPGHARVGRLEDAFPDGQIHAWAILSHGMERSTVAIYEREAKTYAHMR